MSTVSAKVNATTTTPTDSDADDPRITVTGTVKRLFTSSDKFSAGVLNLDGGGEEKFAGPVAVEEGAWVSLSGTWVDDPKWGRQIRVMAWTFAGAGSADGSVDVVGLTRYLSTCSDLRGIGPAKAAKLARAYASTWEPSLADPTVHPAMAQSAGVPLATIQTLAEIWRNRAAHNDMAIWLASFGLTEYQVASVIAEYAPRFGPGAKEALLADPYRMIGEVDGFGFAKVDSIALRMGVVKDHPGRIQAALLWCLEQQESGGGHVWTDRSDLVHAAYLALSLDNPDWQALIDREINSLFASPNPNRRIAQRPGDKLGTARLMDCEDMIRARLAEVGRMWTAFEPDESLLDGLDPSQQAAVRLACKSGGLVITGPAGAGKTTICAKLIKAFQAANKHDILMCAPTGKAARRMTEAMAEFGVAIQGKTIHRLLEYRPPGTWTRNASNPLDAHLLICDESSMVDSTLFYRLLQAINTDRTAVVLVGDHNQLPPVGPGAPLRDILARDLLPIARLTHVHRQAGALKANSTAVLTGQVAPGQAWPKTPDSAVPAWAVIASQTHREADELRATLERLYSVQFPKLRLPSGDPIDMVKDVQLITPVHKGPIGTIELNILLQRIVQKARYGADTPAVKPGHRPAFMVGDRVIQTRNNYNLGPNGCMNGTIGFIRTIGGPFDDGDGQFGMKPGDLLVDFDGEDRPIRIPKKGGCQSDIALAYALSIHRVQGSQMAVIVSVVSTSHTYTAHRNLLYTAVTRASQSCIIVGDPYGIQQAARKVVVDQRRTLLGLPDTAGPDQPVSILSGSSFDVDESAT